MADEKLNTGPAENTSPEAAEPITTPEQAAASEPQQVQIGPTICLKAKFRMRKKQKLQGTIWRGAWDIQKVWDERTTVKRPFVTGCISIKKKGARDFFRAVKTTNIQRT